MPLRTPNLDDRHFLDIVTELRERIPHYCPEWTEYHDSDPGITLMQLFASMTEQLLYRMNQMPRQQYIRFLQLLGIELEGPKAAKADVTFWLTEALPTSDPIKAGTEISTTQTEDKTPIIFSTIEDFKIEIPDLAAVLTADTEELLNGEMRGHPKAVVSANSLLPSNMFSSNIEIFGSTPQAGSSMLLGFSTDLSRHLLRLKVETNQLGDNTASNGVDPRDPPWMWEICVKSDEEEEEWIPCKIDQDTTGGFSYSGSVDIHIPAGMIRYSIEHHTLYWLRVRVANQTSKSEYISSPRIDGISSVDSIGCTIHAEHSRKIEDEVLGVSNGTPGQRFYLNYTPVLPRPSSRDHNEFLVAMTEKDGQFGAWEEVNDFSDSAVRPLPLHYTLDDLTGEVCFGPAVRMPNGTIKEYGVYPPPQTEVRFANYRTGGGVEGNVTEGELNTLKTSIPYVKRVANLAEATGGADAEDIEDALLRAPGRLRARERAVTAEDFELLAKREFAGTFGRVKCLYAESLDNSNPKAETVDAAVSIPAIDLRVIPFIENATGPIPPQQLQQMSAANTATLRTYLDERRLLCTKLVIALPRYHWVATKIVIRPVAGASEEDIERKLLRRLYRLLNPLEGGLDGQGWPFGHDLHTWEIYQCLMQSSEKDVFADDGLDVSLFRVLHIQLYQIKKHEQISVTNSMLNVNLNEQELDTVPHIRVTPDGVIASLRHHIVIAQK